MEDELVDRLTIRLYVVILWMGGEETRLDKVNPSALRLHYNYFMIPQYDYNYDYRSNFIHFFIMIAIVVKEKMPTKVKLAT